MLAQLAGCDANPLLATPYLRPTLRAEGAFDILITKIMLGAYGCVPAFDTYFGRGAPACETFGRKALNRVAPFHAENAEVIEHHRVPTIDFVTGEPTNPRYSRAR